MLQELFSLSVNPWELVLRGTVMYGFLFVLFRFVLRRDTGSMGVADMLLLVVVADAAQNAMAGEYRTVTDGIVLVGTIAAWNWLIDWATYRFPRARRVLEPPTLVLVRGGSIVQRNLDREMITHDELFARLREQGVSRLLQVKVARLEADGTVTVIRADEDGRNAQRAAASVRRATP